MAFWERWLTENFATAGIALLGLVAFLGVVKSKLHERGGRKLLKKAIESKSDEPLTLHPEIDPVACAGCGTCITACPEGEILKLINHKAVLVSPTKCVGHGECEVMCPTGAISLVFGTKTRGMDIPRINSVYESNLSGVYIVGELGGMGLIRNAIRQGVVATQNACKTIRLSSEKADVDILIVGAGPAGMAACLAATEAGRSYLCVEQNSFGGTVYNFPRQKIVMTVPADLPIVGKMRFKSNRVTKEELLDFWKQIRVGNKLRVQEKTQFNGLKKDGGIFVVQTNQGEVRARKVILATGVRGSPRKLGLPNEDLPKVTYNLIDPEQYHACDIAIVGGGNSAVEAAQMLAQPRYGNRVKILVRGAQLERCNEANQNIINKMAAAKQVEIEFNSSVKKIEPSSLAVEQSGKLVEVKNDFLLVFAGAELPHKFLMSLGIQIDKKFGEALEKKAA